MDVLGHEDVAEDEEVVALTELFEGLFEDGAGVVVVEVGTTVVTTEVDSVGVALLLVALEVGRHEGNGSGVPVYLEKNRSLGSSVLGFRWWGVMGGWVVPRKAVRFANAHPELYLV